MSLCGQFGYHCAGNLELFFYTERDLECKQYRERKEKEKKAFSDLAHSLLI